MVESSVCMNIASMAEAVIRPRYGTRVVSDIFLDVSQRVG
jgi:hypothetical protein